MWPELFSQGSELGLFVAGSILAGLAAIIWFAIRAARPLGPDPAADLHQRYEQKDFTSGEMARLVQILADQQAAAEQSVQGFSPARRAKQKDTAHHPITLLDRAGPTARVQRGSMTSSLSAGPR